MSIEEYRRYTFRYCHDVETAGAIRVYVLAQPPYTAPDASMSVIHRWPAANGAPPYICFKEGFKPSAFAAAQRLAHDWADRTDRYIETGVSISNQIARE